MTAAETTAADSPSTTASASRPWRGVLTGLLSVGLLAAILLQLKDASREAVAMLAALPAAAWLVFGLSYFVQPVADFVIFRRLWNLPLGAFEALLRKTAINEAVLGYGGELYLYLWARDRPAMATAPFGAVKDVSILSALGGNLLTLGLLAYAAPRLGALNLSQHLGPALWFGLGLTALSLCVVAFGRRVFSLPAATLVFVGAVHAARLAVFTGLTLLLWRLALPDLSLESWIQLLTLRMVVSRTPFVTNKELVFGNLVLLLAGAKSPAALLVASLALAWLAAHLAVLSALGGLSLLRAARGKAS
ncbi:MAG: hypothetical protein GC203_16255 [Phenylobacterium sp.]|uniref:hypothetical protein n=1 Tax=Phenylobacterium sp. TaxID=1871053 RepID=UPI0025D7976F|nr:hypothetical protein [Phenylobacterium sp.]MBI1199414.1 hypothetical protein [Phenylobacterium sp.]